MSPLALLEDEVTLAAVLLHFGHPSAGSLRMRTADANRTATYGRGRNRHSGRRRSRDPPATEIASGEGFLPACGRPAVIQPWAVRGMPWYRVPPVGNDNLAPVTCHSHRLGSQ